MTPKPRVHVTSSLPAPVLAELRRSFELAPEPREIQGLLPTPALRVDAALLDESGSDLRVVANYGVGYDNVDLAAARERGIVVTNTPDVLTRATAEFAIAILLALVRRVAQGDRLLRARGEWGWDPTFMLGESLDGKTLGCVGFGRIGKETAKLAAGLGMRILHTTRTPGGAGWRPLAELLRESDVVSLHCPLTVETRHLIDERALELVRPATVLVNTARGAVVDERALISALRGSRLAGAALDVFEREPDVAEELLELDNVVLTPHLGSATHAAREGMGMLCVSALRAVLLEGRIPPNAVSGR